MPLHLIAIAKRLAALERAHLPRLSPEAYQEQIEARMLVACERARVERRQSWRPAISSAAIDLLAAALGDRRLLLTIREHRPLWYDFCPPTPYPAGSWETPYYLAGQAAKRTLGTFQAAFDIPNAAMPADVDETIAWLRECIAWDAGSSRAEAV